MTLRDLALLRECSYRKFGCIAEVARGRTELAHWLSLPSPRGKTPPALHDSSSDPTAAPLKPEQPIRPRLPDRSGFPKDTEELNKLYKGNVWKRPYIRSLASWTRRESVLGLSGFFLMTQNPVHDSCFLPWILSFTSDLQTFLFFFYCWLLMHAVFFFYSQENLQLTLERKCLLSSSREQRSPSRLRSKRPDVRRALS